MKKGCHKKKDDDEKGRNEDESQTMIDVTRQEKDEGLQTFLKFSKDYSSRHMILGSLIVYKKKKLGANPKNLVGTVTYGGRGVLVWECMPASGLGMVESPQKCSLEDDCGDAELLTCDLELKVCKCREKFSVLSSAGSCIPARQLGEECVEDAQCRVNGRNTSCEENYCVCDWGFDILHDINGSLCNPAGDESTVASGMNMKVIIILVALSIMSVGICGALHLFSKYGFKDRLSPFTLYFQEKLEKQYFPVHSLCGKTFPESPISTIGPISANLLATLQA
ncbi:hypothetical protein AVEN_184087-1 [Araneus ventricosus]|uniref:EB domain-containing protein n=1 Tax=Araneus ventricosus TaxID=182803 RepID=A0A4Y2CY58_ARAVE|nr:hypothetical protein AVEN_184087-1 [Araneus ventricosus]